MLSLAGNLGMVEVAPAMAWVTSTPAVVALSVAACLEMCGYLIPWVDHALDVVAAPAAALAGTAVAASQFGLVGGGAEAGSGVTPGRLRGFHV
jgi:hypothetical protein